MCGLCGDDLPRDARALHMVLYQHIVYGSPENTNAIKCESLEQFLRKHWSDTRLRRAFEASQLYPEAAKTAKELPVDQDPWIPTHNTPVCEKLKSNAISEPSRIWFKYLGVETNTKQTTTTTT